MRVFLTYSTIFRLSSTEFFFFLRTETIENKHRKQYFLYVYMYICVSLLDYEFSKRMTDEILKSSDQIYKKLINLILCMIM